MAKVDGYLKMICAVFVLIIALSVGFGGYSLFSQGEISLSTFGVIALFAIGFLVLSFRFGQASRRRFREWQQIEEQCRLNSVPSPGLSNLLKNYFRAQNSAQNPDQEIAEMLFVVDDENWTNPF